MPRLILLLAIALPMFGQSSDAVLTQTLINEIRALRQQLEATNVTSQRVQIALYRLQSQTALVAAAQQRADASRQHLLETQMRHKEIADHFQQAEEAIHNTQDANQKKAFESELPRAKAMIEMLTAEESARQSALADAESQARIEQAKLADLQALLDRLDKALDALSRPK